MHYSFLRGMKINMYNINIVGMEQLFYTIISLIFRMYAVHVCAVNIFFLSFSNKAGIQLLTHNFLTLNCEIYNLRICKQQTNQMLIQ